MTHERSALPGQFLPDEATAVARQALHESRLRGLPAAEEYRVIADRLYRHGIRDLPPGALLHWIERSVAQEYEQLLTLRAFGERLHGAIAAGDLAQAAWLLISELPAESRAKLAAGMQALDNLEGSGNAEGMGKGEQGTVGW
jgi:hypothetical protein